MPRFLGPGYVRWSKNSRPWQRSSSGSRARPARSAVHYNPESVLSPCLCSGHLAFVEDPSLSPKASVPLLAPDSGLRLKESLCGPGSRAWAPEQRLAEPGLWLDSDRFYLGGLGPPDARPGPTTRSSWARLKNDALKFVLFRVEITARMMQRIGVFEPFAR